MQLLHTKPSKFSVSFYHQDVFCLHLLQTPQDEPGIHFQPFGCFPSNRHSVSIPSTLQKAVLPVISQPNLLGRGREGNRGGEGPTWVFYVLAFSSRLPRGKTLLRAGLGAQDLVTVPGVCGIPDRGQNVHVRAFASTCL